MTLYLLGNMLQLSSRAPYLMAFISPLFKKITTMEVMKKGVKIGDKTVYDMEKLYGQLLVLS